MTYDRRYIYIYIFYLREFNLKASFNAAGMTIILNKYFTPCPDTVDLQLFRMFLFIDEFSPNRLACIWTYMDGFSIYDHVHFTARSFTNHPPQLSLKCIYTAHHWTSSENSQGCCLKTTSKIFCDFNLSFSYNWTFSSKTVRSCKGYNFRHNVASKKENVQYLVEMLSWGFVFAWRACMSYR